jgi:hypothetical protein
MAEIDTSGFAKPPQGQAPMSLGDIVNLGQGITNLQRNQAQLQAQQAYSRFASDPKNQDAYGLPRAELWGKFKADNHILTSPEIESQIAGTIATNAETKVKLQKTAAEVMSGLIGNKDPHAWDDAFRRLAKTMPAPAVAEFGNIAHMPDAKERDRAAINFAYSYGVPMQTSTQPTPGGGESLQPAARGAGMIVGAGAPTVASPRGTPKQKDIGDTGQDYINYEYDRQGPGRNEPGAGQPVANEGMRKAWKDAGEASANYDKNIAPMANALIKIKELGPGGTGVTRDAINFYKGLWSQLKYLGGKEMTEKDWEDPVKFQEAKKYLQQAINRQAGGATDQMGEMFKIGNPNMDLLQPANMALGQMAITMERVDTVARRIWDQLNDIKDANGNTIGAYRFQPEKYEAWKADWMKHQDIRGFGIDLMKDSDRKAFMDKLEREGRFDEMERIIESSVAAKQAGVTGRTGYHPGE